jgi:hypothetical protein
MLLLPEGLASAADSLAREDIAAAAPAVSARVVLPKQIKQYITNLQEVWVKQNK